MTTIPIELLTTETLIRVAGTRDAARVIAIRFDGYGYSIDLRYGPSDDGYEECMYVDADGSVDFEGVGEPVLRTESDVTKDEWQAKADAIDADILQLQGKINAAQGHVCQPVDEARRAQFFDAVAKALGVPALEAAE